MLGGSKHTRADQTIGMVQLDSPLHGIWYSWSHETTSIRAGALLVQYIFCVMPFGGVVNNVLSCNAR
jgi:hypothetical protein